MTDLLLEDVVRQKEPGPKILICDRGAIDEVALAFRAKSNENFEEKDPELMKEVLRIFLIGMAHTEILIDAVVLYGVSLDTAIRRRKERGLSSEGRVTNELIWPTFEYSYSWWLGSVYPLLRKRSGTGLLIIDGEGEKEENNLNLLSYVKEATELIF